MTYKAQKSAWMDSNLFTEWYINNFIPSVNRFRKDNNKSGKVLLFLSNAPSHPSAEILNSLDDNFKIMFPPPNVTAILQPMDQGVIEKLKKLYKKQVLRRLLLSENDCESVVAFAKKLHLRTAATC